MSHRLIRWFVPLLFLAAATAGCRQGPPPRPAYNTMEEALGKVLGLQAAIAYREPFGGSRSLVLFRTDKHRGLSATILEQTLLGKWRMTDAVSLGGELPRVGALSYERANLGHVEEKIGRTTFATSETHVIFGEVLDPAITWVELTLDEEGAKPINATVKDGIWLVKVSPKAQNTWFHLRAGNAEGRRFTASIATGPWRETDPNRAPLVEYYDAQQGIRLEYPSLFSHPRVDRDGRLTIAFSSWTISVEPAPAAELGQLLKSAVAAGGDRVLAHGIRQVGTRQVGHVLEARPEEDGRGSTYLSHYLVPAGRSHFTLTCSAPHMYSLDFWKEYWEPVCERVLPTMQMDTK
ncbi:MAG TPA: hypothetical protein VD969_25210 [Symbiobacteriaceae bacterium]|nr:hypothetical protein [Symbiobacteriaceae bacterium]